MQKKEITSWVIALVGSKTVIGKRDPVDRSTLSPVYELECGIVQAPTGQTGIAHRCAPICWLPSVDRFGDFLGLHDANRGLPSIASRPRRTRESRRGSRGYRRKYPSGAGWDRHRPR